MNQEYTAPCLPLPPSFDVGQILRAAWARFKLHWGVWVLASITCGVLSTIPSILGTGIDLVVGSDNAETILSLSFRVVLSIFSVALTLFLEAGILRMFVSAARGGPVRLGDLFSGGRFVLPLLLAQVLLGVAFSVLCAPFAFILFLFSRSIVVMIVCAIIMVIPMAIAIVRFGLAPFFIVDRSLGPLDAIRASWNATRGFWASLVLLGIWTSFVASSATLLTCGLAVVATGPFLGLTHAVAYAVCSRDAQV